MAALVPPLAAPGGGGDSAAVVLPPGSPSPAGFLAGAASVSARTSRTPSTARADAISSAKASHNDCDTPPAAATGPHTASPSGRKANEPNQSYALTREREAAGTWRCRVDSHTVLPYIIAAPEPNAAAASSGADAAAARKASGSAKTGTASVAATSGRRGCARMARMPPASPPTPIADNTAPHVAAPPRSRSATPGPITDHAPHSMFPTAAPATNAHTQVIARKVLQPSR